MRVAFVAPFYGARAAGGAESECRHTAIRLAASGVEVEVFTTCVLDLQHDWNVNGYPQGLSVEDGIPVHRFRREVADPMAFSVLNDRLLRGEQLAPEEERRFMALHVTSPGLLRALADARGRFDRFVFIPYLFGTTYHGMMVCPERSVLIPCLHDEGYARMRTTAETFGRAARIVYHTEAERILALRLFGADAEKGAVLGEGVDTAFESDGERFRQKHGVKGPFVLYAGRKDRTKNVDTLIRYFLASRTRMGNRLQLVLIGPGSMTIPPEAAGSIVDLGFVFEQDKRDAYSAALALCQPSLNESFSIVMMEAWACGTPCLVHGGCAVTKEHVLASGGGLYFDDERDFAGCLEFFYGRPHEVFAMGAAGRRYVNANFGWDRIIPRYREELFGLPAAGSARPA